MLNIIPNYSWRGSRQVFLFMLKLNINDIASVLDAVSHHFLQCSIVLGALDRQNMEANFYL